MNMQLSATFHIFANVLKETNQVMDF